MKNFPKNTITAMEYYAVNSQGCKSRLLCKTLSSAKKTATMRGCKNLIATEVIYREQKNRIRKIGQVDFVYKKEKSWKCQDNETGNGHGMRTLINYCNNLIKG